MENFVLRNYQLIKIGAIAFTITTLCLIIIIGACIVYQERKRVYNMPKRPMSLCDHHGPYPTSSSLFITVPEEGKPDLRQEICPMCFEERTEQTKRKLKAEEKERERIIQDADGRA